MDIQVSTQDRELFQRVMRLTHLFHLEIVSEVVGSPEQARRDCDEYIRGWFPLLEVLPTAAGLFLLTERDGVPKGILTPWGCWLLSRKRLRPSRETVDSFLSHVEIGQVIVDERTTRIDGTCYPVLAVDDTILPEPALREGGPTSIDLSTANRMVWDELLEGYEYQPLYPTS